MLTSQHIGCRSGMSLPTDKACNNLDVDIFGVALKVDPSCLKLPWRVLHPAPRTNLGSLTPKEPEKPQRRRRSAPQRRYARGCTLDTPTPARATPPC